MEPLLAVLVGSRLQAHVPDVFLIGEIKLVGDVVACDPGGLRIELRPEADIGQPSGWSTGNLPAEPDIAAEGLRRSRGREEQQDEKYGDNR